MKKTPKFSKITKMFCLGLGMASILSIVPVPAHATDAEDYEAAASKIFTPEQMAQMKKDVDEQFKDVKYDEAITTPEVIPTDGDAKNLNIGWTDNQGDIYYCKDASRIKVTDWQKIDGGWYFFDSSNYEMQTGWLQVNGAWYYFKDYSDFGDKEVSLEDGLGKMQTGWLNDGGTWYYLNGSGAMATNTTIDGYTINSSGVWTR